MRRFEEADPYGRSLLKGEADVAVPCRARPCVCSVSPGQGPVVPTWKWAIHPTWKDRSGPRAVTGSGRRAKAVADLESVASRDQLGAG